MSRRAALAMLALALLLAVVPTAAQAKGASAATISGGGPGGLPGGPIDLKGDGEPVTGAELDAWRKLSYADLAFEIHQRRSPDGGEMPIRLQALSEIIRRMSGAP